jgi:hypothetical protein
VVLVAADENELSVANVDRLIIERDDYKQRWEVMARVASRQLQRLEDDLKRERAARAAVDEALRDALAEHEHIRDEALSYKREAERYRRGLRAAPMPERESTHKGEDWHEHYGEWWHAHASEAAIEGRRSGHA